MKKLILLGIIGAFSSSLFSQTNWTKHPGNPVMFAGAGLPAATVNRPVTPYDIAPTLAAILGTKPPSGAIGKPLVEVLEQ